MKLDNQPVREYIAEAEVIPPVVDSLLKSDHKRARIAISILSKLASQDQSCSQMLSLDLVPKLGRLIMKHHDLSLTLFSKLCRQASIEQLTPTFSFLVLALQSQSLDDDCCFLQAIKTLTCLIRSSTSDLTQLITEKHLVEVLLSAAIRKQDSSDILESLYKILFSVYHEYLPLPIDDTHLSAWELFLAKISPENIREDIVGSIIKTCVIHCPDLKSIVDHGLISLYFFLIPSESRDDDFIRWLLNLINHIVTVRAQMEGGRAQAVLFLDHLVDLGVLSILLKSVAQDEGPIKRVVKGIKQLIQFDEKYEAQLKMFPLVKLLFSLFPETSDSSSMKRKRGEDEEEEEEEKEEEKEEEERIDI
jgi:hypothetical protein